MPLTMRPTGLGSEIDKDRPDYTVYCGEWDVGRIYQTRRGPDSLRWFWSLTVNDAPNRPWLPGSTRTGRTTLSIAADGKSAAFTRPAAVLTTCVGSGRHRHCPMTRSGRVATLEEAKAQFS